MTTSVDRPLGGCEALAWFASRACRYNVVCAADVDGPLTPDALRAALDALPARHPLLRARVDWDAERGGAAWFRATEQPIPLRVVDAADPLAEVEPELDLPMPDDGPLARCVLVRRGAQRATILLVFHHAIGDGMSGAFVIRDLLDGAAAALAGRPVAYEPLAPYGCLEQHLPPQPGWLRRIWEIVKVFARILQRGEPRQLPRDGKAPATARRTRFAEVTLDAPTVSALSARARAERSSVFGALAAAIMVAIAEEFPGKRSRVNCGTPVNMRATLAPPVGESLGLYVTATPVVVEVPAAADFWSVARDAKEALVSAIDRGDHVTIASFMGAVGAIVARLSRGRRGVQRAAGFIEATGTPSFALSNIGTLAIAREHGPLEWRSLGFAAGGSLTCHFGSFAATLGGVLRWTFVWTDPLVSDERARRLVERARARLLDAATAAASVDAEARAAS